MRSRTQILLVLLGLVLIFEKDFAESAFDSCDKGTKMNFLLI